MKKYAPLLVAAGLLLAGAGCTGTTSIDVNAPAPAPAPPAQPPAAVQGRAVYSITDDAAADMKGVTAVMLTVDKLETHSEASGWITVSTATNAYDLLKLKASGSAQLLADARLDAGTYDQVRLHVTKVEVTANGKTAEAKLPSNTLQIKGALTVKAGETSSAMLDFMVDKSLHLTGTGKYILAPVVRLLIRGTADVKLDSDDKVRVEAGETESDEHEGMDEKGEMHEDFELKDELDLDTDGSIRIHTGR